MLGLVVVLLLIGGFALFGITELRANALAGPVGSLLLVEIGVPIAFNLLRELLESGGGSDALIVVSEGARALILLSIGYLLWKEWSGTGPVESVAESTV